jgi:SEC-C motif
VRYTERVTKPTTARPGRNEPCACGSGRKYKHCCLAKDEAKAAAARAKAAAKPRAPEAPEGSEPSDAPAPGRTRAPKHQTEQPWKSATTRGFVQRARTPRKVGGG